jgi:hypothetical protein
MLQLGEKVYIVGDSIEQDLPIGDYGYIIAYDRNADNIFDYVIRIPRLNKQFYVPAEDIEPESVLLEEEVSRIEKEALIDFALATKNEELFYHIMNGNRDSEDRLETSKEVQSTENFIKQINLRAWI